MKDCVSIPRDRRRLVLITSQAFSLSNFRGPLMRDATARGWAVFAVAPDFDEETRAAVRSYGAQPVDCTLSRTGVNPLVDLRDMVRLAFLLRRLQADATLGYFIKPVVYGTIAAWMARVPKRFALLAGLGYVFIAPLEAGASSKRRALRYFVSHMYRFALARADVVFFQNSDDLEEFVDLNLVERNRARNTRGTGVDLQTWQPASPVPAPVTFLLAARLLEDKGILEYVEAARLIKARYPQARFILLGGLDSNPTAIAEDVVAGWVKEGLLEWPGHVRVEPWLSQASVYVLPSYREGVPRSTQEAMAMGRPVITTDVPGCRETVVDGKNGFLIPSRDVPALAAAMQRFIENPSLIDTMGKASRQLAEERFDIRRVNAMMLETMGI
jgi:glycosyltransferase involved in cell wall biosynthesis